MLKLHEIVPEKLYTGILPDSLIKYRLYKSVGPMVVVFVDALMKLEPSVKPEYGFPLYETDMLITIFLGFRLLEKVPLTNE